MRDYLDYVKLKKMYCDIEILFGNISDKGKLTYVIPTYKRFDLLKRCVASIINQNECDHDYSIIISDNNFETIQDFKINPQKYSFFKNNGVIYCVNKKNIGGGANCNQAVLLAKTTYICMVHDLSLIHI